MVCLFGMLCISVIHSTLRTLIHKVFGCVCVRVYERRVNISQMEFSGSGGTGGGSVIFELNMYYVFGFNYAISCARCLGLQHSERKWDSISLSNTTAVILKSTWQLILGIQQYPSSVQTVPLLTLLTFYYDFFVRKREREKVQTAYTITFTFKQYILYNNCTTVRLLKCAEFEKAEKVLTIPVNYDTDAIIPMHKQVQKMQTNTI